MSMHYGTGYGRGFDSWLGSKLGHERAATILFLYQYLKWVLLVALLAVLGLMVTYYYALPQYREWKRAELVSRAQAQYEQGEYKAAVFTLRRLMEMGGAKNVEAWRVIARVFDKVGSRDALLAWKEVNKLAPGSTDDLLAWAESAIRLGSAGEAIHAILKLPKADRTGARFHTVSAQASEKLGNPVHAAFHYKKALEFGETERGKLDLGRMELSIPPLKKQGIERMNGLRESSETEVARDAQRVLIPALMQTGQVEQGLAVVNELKDGQSNPSTDDWLLILDGLLAGKSDQFDAVLAEAQTQLGESAGAARLAIWMANRNRGEAALEFLAALPEKEQKTPAVARARGFVLIALREWSRIATELPEEDWQHLGYLRNVYLTRALLEEGRTSEARARWREALVSARLNLGELLDMLDRINRQALREADPDLFAENRIDLWKVIAEQYPSEKWASQMLLKHYLEEQDASGFYEALGLALRSNAGDEELRYNRALVGLWIGEADRSTSRLLGELAEKDPDNPARRVAYALALFQEAKLVKAAAELDKLKPDAFEHPSRAAYASLVYAAAGQEEKADGMLASIDESKLWPEENRLARRARQIVAFRRNLRDYNANPGEAEREQLRQLFRETMEAGPTRTASGDVDAEGLRRVIESNPLIFMGEALGRLREGKTFSGLGLLSSIPVRTLNGVERLVYYGVLLEALGLPGRARPYLEISAGQLSTAVEEPVDLIIAGWQKLRPQFGEHAWFRAGLFRAYEAQDALREEGQWIFADEEKAEQLALVDEALARGTNQYGVNERLKALLKGEPETAEYEARLAYLTHLSGQSRAALSMIRTLRGDQLKQPRVAYFFGLILAHENQATEALHYLNLAKAAELNDLERQLWQGALTRMEAEQMK